MTLSAAIPVRPSITAKGEVIGAAFDGNIESLGGAFGFDDRVNRTVSVSTAAITEALRNVYDNKTLADEVGREKPPVNGATRRQCSGLRRGAADALPRLALAPPKQAKSRLILLGTGGGPTPKPNRGPRLPR